MAEAAYQQPARELSAQRQQAAAKLTEETTEHMQQLSMRGARFHIELIPCEAQAYGLEQVQFQVAANQGSPLRPLNKVASGGELARISLALQVTASQYTQIPTLIFDEVDSGIGGGVAVSAAKAACWPNGCAAATTKPIETAPFLTNRRHASRAATGRCWPGWLWA